MNENKKVYFKCHTPQLLTELCDGVLKSGNFGVLKIPINTLRIYLVLVAQRAAQINDPILNELMCNMTLYEVADPYSKDYNKKILDQVKKDADKQRIKEKEA